jgi:hypothetical protein
MPYALKLYAYLFLAYLLATIIAVRWIKPFGFMACIGFALLYSYIMIIVGRRLFGRKNL